MSSFVFEIRLFNPTITTSHFSKDVKTAAFVDFLNGFVGSENSTTINQHIS